MAIYRSLILGTLLPLSYSGIWVSPVQAQIREAPKITEEFIDHRLQVSEVQKYSTRASVYLLYGKGRVGEECTPPQCEALYLTRQENQNTQVRKIEFTITAAANQTFDELIQQARLVAQRFIEQGFSESPDVTEIVVSILGERHSQTIPLLSARVSRADWQVQPRVEQWAREVGIPAKVLLGFMAPQIQQPLRASSDSSSRNIRRRGRGASRRREIRRQLR